MDQKRRSTVAGIGRSAEFGIEVPSSVWADLARMIYQHGLAVGRGRWIEMRVWTGPDTQSALMIGNDHEGVVDVICPNPVIGAELRRFVGIRVLSA